MNHILARRSAHNCWRKLVVALEESIVDDRDSDRAMYELDKLYKLKGADIFMF